MTKTYLLPLMAGAVIGSAALADPAACPPREVGTYPWTDNGILPGDLWGWVYLTIGKDGRPQRCGMGKTNIDDSDLRFFACKAFTDDWKPASAVEPVPGSVVKRLFIMPGPNHEKADKDARKRFFAEHPDQRPECYPE